MIKMLIMDFIGECSNPENLQVAIYDADAGDVIWEGCADDVPGYLEDQSISGFDAPEGDVITINVCGVKSWPMWTYRNGKPHKSPWA